MTSALLLLGVRLKNNIKKGKKKLAVSCMSSTFLLAMLAPLLSLVDEDNKYDQ